MSDEEKNIQDARFPAGKFSRKEDYSPEEMNGFINDFSLLPERLKKLVDSATAADLNRSYRPGGWTMAQVVHHVSDSHMNFLIRMKLALTEDVPIIKPYAENKWAETAEYTPDDLADSVMIIEAVHRKIIKILKNLSEDDLKKSFYHPENKKHFTIKQVTALYSWHFRHHIGHIERCLETVK
ncbi:MAG: putative metal-dependent hydrolase [Ignavibacteriaceae bacterium]|nr:putative metal-dependent hydrolase [Ignavibacteriaceae bacterium]